MQELKKQDDEKKEHYKMVLNGILDRIKYDPDREILQEMPEANFIDDGKDESLILPTSQAQSRKS